MAMNKRTKRATESVAFLTVTAAIVVLLNILGIFTFGRIDVTEKRLFSLSSGSERVLHSLVEDLEISAYFTKDLPPPFNATERYVRDLLDEYVAAAKGEGKLIVHFVDPDGEEGKAAAEADGLQRVAHQKIVNDSVTIKEGYRGLVFKYKGEQRAIAAVSGTEGLEYDITQTIKELLGQKTQIGVLMGHQGPSLMHGLSTLQELLPTYTMVDVDAAKPIDPALKALLVVGPETPLTDDELRNIDAFVMKGRGLAVFGGTNKVMREQAAISGVTFDTGINRLLEKWGVAIGKEMVADAIATELPASAGPGGQQMVVRFPPVPIVAFDAEQAAHPVAYRLDQAFFPFSSVIRQNDALKNHKDVTATILARTSKASWLLEGDNIDLKPRAPREWTMGSKRGPFPLAIAIEGKLPSAFAGQGPRGPALSETPVHLFVAGTSGIVRDDFLPPKEKTSKQERAGFLSFSLNAVDWLAQEDELIAIRAKSVDEPVVEIPADVKQAEEEAKNAVEEGNRSGAEAAIEKRKEALEDWEAKKSQTKLLNIALTPLLFIAFGLIRWQVRRKKRANVSL
jgi:ABC-2 type transport system permease protein